MKRIEKMMHTLQKNNEKAFIPYIMAGDDGLQTLTERIVFLEKAGATAIEIGIPFSDPVADGPVIQEAGMKALKNGVTLKQVIQKIAELRPIVHIPLIIMTYMNPVYAYGIHSFIDNCSNAGVDGLIIPDLPIEEEDILDPHIEQYGIELIRLVTLTSPIERIKEISQKGNGFLYAVTVTGTTGTRKIFNQEVGEHIRNIKKVSKLPVLAGFGISTPEQVREMCQYCDGVIVGSKIIELFGQNKLQQIEELIQAPKVYLRGVTNSSKR